MMWEKEEEEKVKFRDVERRCRALELIGLNQIRIRSEEKEDKESANL